MREQVFIVPNDGVADLRFYNGRRELHVVDCDFDSLSKRKLPLNEGSYENERFDHFTSLSTVDVLRGQGELVYWVLLFR